MAHINLECLLFLEIWSDFYLAISKTMNSSIIVNKLRTFFSYLSFRYRNMEFSIKISFIQILLLVLAGFVSLYFKELDRCLEDNQESQRTCLIRSFSNAIKGGTQWAFEPLIWNKAILLLIDCFLFRFSSQTLDCCFWLLNWAPFCFDANLVLLTPFRSSRIRPRQSGCFFSSSLLPNRSDNSIL